MPLPRCLLRLGKECFGTSANELLTFFVRSSIFSSTSAVAAWTARFNDQFGVSRVQFGVSRVQFGVSRVQFGVPRVQFGVPRVQFGVPRVQFGVSRVQFGVS
jgi:hypothetical protein